MQFLRISQEVWQPACTVHIMLCHACMGESHCMPMLSTCSVFLHQMHAPVSEEEVTGELEKPSFAGAAGGM